MENQPLKMIPTCVRDKIPHQLSFVASAKTLSLAWQDVPQFDLLRLWFSCNIPKALRTANQPRLVLEVHYSYMSVNHFMPSSWPEEYSWDVRVGVCHCQEAHEMRQWLHDEGLTMSRLWLEQQAKSDGDTTSACWRADFDEDLREFRVTHSK